MKRSLYVLFAFLLLLGAFSGYQYMQYEEHLEALKSATRNQAPTVLPVDTVAVADPPAETYYTHHHQLSSIGSYNPLLRATVQRKLHFYDYTQQNEALLDFINLLNYRERLLAQATPTEHSSIEQQMQQYKEQLCTRWSAFADHLKQAYPDMPEATALHKLCIERAEEAYKKDVIMGWLIDPVVD